MHLLVLHGPNLRSLGTRQPELYGAHTLSQINERLQEEAAALGARLIAHQSNHEGQLIDWLEEYRQNMDGCILNAAGYTHTSVALLDAVLAFGKPVVEVHLTEPREREEFRHTCLVGEVCEARFAGKGVESYVEGLRWLVDHLSPSLESEEGS